MDLKKFFIILTFLCVLILGLQEKVYANDDIIYEGDYVFEISSGSIIEYTGTSSVVIIPDEIQGYPVYKIGDRAFGVNYNLKSVTLPENTKVIDTAAFVSCRNLVEVNLNDGLETLRDSAFAMTYSLEKIDLPSTINYIGNRCFYNSRLLSKVEIPYGVTIINGGTFEGCNKLSELIIPSSVTSIGGTAFQNCNGLKRVDIPGSVKTIENCAFLACHSLEQVKFNHGVKTIKNQVFMNCEKLQTATLPSSVTSIGVSAFWKNVSGEIIESFTIFCPDNSYSKSYSINNNIPYKLNEVEDVCIVTYNLNGGSWQEDTSESVKKGSYLIKPSCNPVKSNYKFKGWYINPECVGMPIFQRGMGITRIKLYNDVVLYAKWESAYNNRIVSGKDDLSWSNSAESFFDSKPYNIRNVSGDYYDVLYKDFDFVTKALLELQIFFGKEWNGGCFGMSSVVALIKYGELDPYFFQKNAAITYDLNMPKDSETIRNLINYYHLSQGSPKSRRIKGSLLNKPTKEAVGLLIEAVNKVKKGAIPVRVGIQYDYYDDEGNLKTANHAILAYDVIDNDYCKEIKIYDPSGCTTELRYFEETDDIFYSYFSNMKITDIADSVSDYHTNIQSALISRGVDRAYDLEDSFAYRSESQDAICYLNTNCMKFIITNSSGQSAVVDGLESTGDLEFEYMYPNNEMGFDAEYVYVLSDISNYTITQFDDGELDEYKIMFQYNYGENSFLNHVSAQCPGVITFNANGSFSTNYESDTFQTVSTTRNDSQTPWYTTEVSAIETGLMLENVTGEVAITALDGNLDGTEINVNDDYNKVGVELNASEASVLTSYSSSDDAMVVKNSGEVEEIASAGMLYSVNYNTYGGSIVETQINLESGSHVNIPDEPTFFGCLFGGWFKDADCTAGQEWSFENDIIEKNTTLHAKWIIDENSSHTLLFKPEFKNDEIQIVVNDGENFTQLPDIPDKTGYSARWEDVDLSNITSDMVINAIYERTKDLNNNGVVDMQDIAIVAMNYNKYDYDCDVNDDFVVNIYDLIVLAKELK